MPPPDLTAHAAAWDVRYRDPDEFERRVAALPPGPVTDFLRARIAEMHEQPDVALERLRDAEEGLPEPSVWRARVFETRGIVLDRLGMSDQASAAHMTAWSLYDEVGDELGQAAIRQNVASLAMQPLDTALGLYEEALERAERIGADDLAGIILLNMQNALLGHGPQATTDALLERAYDLLATSWPAMTVLARRLQIDVALDRGDIARARALTADVPDPLSLHDTSVRPGLVLALSRLACAEGNPEGAVALLSECLQLPLIPVDRPVLERRLAQAWLEAGRPEEAAEHALRAFDLLDEYRLAEEERTARALDVLHRTAVLKRDTEAQRRRADALEKALADLREATDHIHELSIRDAVTGLHNRQHLIDRATGVLSRATTERPVEVALIDLDRFKAVNDTYGHATGDEVLRAFSRALTRATRRTDIVARYGGEEFVVVRPARRGDDEPLAVVLDRLRADLAEAGPAAGAGRGDREVPGREAGPRPGGGGDRSGGAPPVGRDVGGRHDLPPITFSAGVAVATGESVEDVLRRADELMYAAKDAGRDCVRAQPAPESTPESAPRCGPASRSGSDSGSGSDSAPRCESTPRSESESEPAPEPAPRSESEPDEGLVSRAS